MSNNNNNRFPMAHGKVKSNDKDEDNSRRKRCEPHKSRQLQMGLDDAMSWP